MEAAFLFPSTVLSGAGAAQEPWTGWNWPAGTPGWTPKGREGALLLPPVLRAKKNPTKPIHTHPRHLPRPLLLLLLPGNWAQFLIQVFYASLATLKTIPKTDKKDKKTKKKKKKKGQNLKKASSRPCLLCEDGTEEPPCPGTGTWQHQDRALPLLQPC